jgi:hypothetical protein
VDGKEAPVFNEVTGALASSQAGASDFMIELTRAPDIPPATRAKRSTIDAAASRAGR